MILFNTLESDMKTPTKTLTAVAISFVSPFLMKFHEMQETESILLIKKKLERVP